MTPNQKMLTFGITIYSIVIALFILALFNYANGLEFFIKNIDTPTLRVLYGKCERKSLEANTIRDELLYRDIRGALIQEGFIVPANVENTP